MVLKSLRRAEFSWMEVAIVTFFWLLLLIVVPMSWNIDWPGEFWIKQVIFALTLSLVYFVNSKFWVKQVLVEKGLLRYGLYVVFSTIVVLVVIQLVERSLNLPELMHQVFRPNKPFKERPLFFRYDFPGMLQVLLAFGISTIISLVKKAQQDALLREELEKEKASNELSYLKAQINPHFFFNTLNSIYALTSLNIESARDAIHTLSAMMRYVLYDSRKDHTMLSQEMQFIENYINLMKLRLSKKVVLTFDKPETIKDELIAPMLLLPFVENAFKHGISSKHPSEIKVSLTQDGNRFVLFTQNQVFENTEHNLDESGIGMTNTKRRLELIYPNNYELNISEKDGLFTVYLSIDLG